MKITNLFLPLLFVVLISGFNTFSGDELDQRNGQDNHSDFKNDSLQVTKLVYDFFDAFDNRETKKILHSNSVIVHNNGVETTQKEMLNIIKKAKKWSTRKEVKRLYFPL